MKPVQNIIIPFTVGVVLINFLVIALLVLSIRESRILYQEQAAISSRNLAQVLDENIKGIFDRVDLILLSVTDETGKQIRGGGIRKQVLNAYIARQLERVPELDSLRMTNANGDILYGPGVVPGINIADRDYFYSLRDDPKTGVSLSRPYVSRITGKWQISISRRILKPDGSFDGIAYGNFTLDYFTRMFSRINVGMRGAIAMWNMDLELIARYPEPKIAGSEAGLKLRSTAFNESIRAAKEMGTYTTQSNVDRIERSFSYRKISKYPIYILVGMATQDYLAHWRKEAVKKSALGVSFFLLSFFFTYLFHKYLTESKLAAEALLASERRYKAIVENQAEFVTRYLTGGVVTFVNDTFCKYLNMERDDLIGKSFFSFIYEEDRPSFIRQIGSLGIDIPSVVAEARVILTDGRIAWHKWTHSAIFDKEGNIIEYQATGRDITATKRVEEALRSSEFRFRTIIENASAGIMVADIGTQQIRYANPEMCRMLGYNEHEFCTLTINDIPVQAELQESVSRFKAHAEGKIHSSEGTFKRKDGSPVRMNINSVRMEIDNRQCLVGFFSDVTEKHLLEEERLKTQKLEAIGTLAGGIAHDFNNLLQGIFGYISLAKLKKNDPEKCIASLAEAERALHLSVKLTNQLLTFSKGGRPVKKLIDLRPVIEDATKLAISGSRSDYRISADDGLWQAEADEGQIGQVIQNIVLNADQAMIAGGTVKIEVKNVKAPGGGLPSELQAGRYIEIAISDNGTGISRQYMSKIFDPYFTTKEKGSGLGLATSYSIIKNHGGLISVASEPGKGTTFLIRLPASEMKEEFNKSPIVTSVARKGKILVMDDEAMVRSLAGDLIKALGHEVELAKHGESAIEKYTAAIESGNPFDIVILDLTIRGGLGGRDTIERLRAIDPDVRAIVSSGYSDDAVVADYENYGFKARLTKPYKLSDLRDALNLLLRR